MIRTIARVLAGFALASLMAGIVQVLFALPPGPLLAEPASIFADRAGRLVELMLLAATHAAIFSAAFALIAALIGEWTATRGVGYYLFVGMLIAVLGFSAQYASEVPAQPTVMNNYALKAFLTSGFFAGLVYWLVAGRSAGRPPASQDRDSDSIATIGVPPPAKTWKARPRLIIEDAPQPGTKAARATSLAERLATADDVATAEKIRIAKAIDDTGPATAAASPQAEPKADAKGTPKSTEKSDARAASPPTSSVPLTRARDDLADEKPPSRKP
jgi:hypothetical protein